MKIENLAKYLEKDEQELVEEIAQNLDFDITITMSFVVSLLEEVNAHTEAKVVNKLLNLAHDSKLLKKVENAIDGVLRTL